ncbi:transcription antitermination factor NusB [Bacillus altitudinis]
MNKNQILFSRNWFSVCSNKRTNSNDMISQHLVNWKLDRIANVDRAILRLSVYEMVYQEDIPVSVSMNEAIELAKLFGDDKAPKFVNGVLSNIKNDLKQ